jgi:hypothetical protein
VSSNFNANNRITLAGVVNLLGRSALRGGLMFLSVGDMSKLVSGFRKLTRPAKRPIDLQSNGAGDSAECAATIVAKRIEDLQFQFSGQYRMTANRFAET